MTTDQALAFVEVCKKSPKVQSHLESALGYDKVPSPKDFSNPQQEAVDRCSDFIAYIQEAIGVLSAVNDDRPVQAEASFEGKKRRVRVPAENVE